MAKRGAGYQLTHDNWDQEEESEEAGVFVSASADEMKNRVIKKAKRRAPNSSEGSASPFSTFSGFGTGSSKPAAFAGFSFEAKKNTDGDKATSNGQLASDKKSSLGSFSFGMGKNDATKDQASSDGPKSTFSFTSNSNARNKTEIASKDENFSDDGSYSNEYYKSLKCLNEGFLSWIQKHMSQSNYCIFTPVFKDYENHLSALEKKYKIENSTAKSKTASVSSTDSTGFSFYASDKSTCSSSSAITPADKTTSTFSFGIAHNNNSDKPASGFSFAATPASKPEMKAEGHAADDADKLPEEEVKEIVEDDAFYSQKCKLFFKKSGNFVEKGLGNLFLKKADGKTQFLVRAATNLGNILLNIFLNSSMPVSRVGKNNVMIVCIPNPPIDLKEDKSNEPTPMLIRVRTSDEADELLEIINNCIKEQ